MNLTPRRLSVNAITDFSINIPDAALKDLRSRLAATRWGGDFGGDDWRFGTNGHYLKSLVAFWLEEYDWRAREREMNRFAQARTTIAGTPIHFAHVRGRGPAPIPLVLSHGWPWTFWDFHKVIGPLTDP